MYSHIFTSGASLALISSLALAADTSTIDKILSGVIGFGNAYETQSDLFLNFSRQALTPFRSNKLAFQGFNFSAPLTTLNSPPNTASSETWNLQLNLTTLVVDSGLTPSTTDLITNVVYGIELPGNQGSLPFVSDTNYTMCVSIMAGWFPTNINNIRGGGPASQAYDPTNSSCVPFVGQKCVDGLVAHFQNATISSGSLQCPTLSGSITDIPGCTSADWAEYDGFATSSLMNMTDSNIIRNASGPWTSATPFWNTTNASNSSDYTLVPNPPGPAFHGLKSSQPFLWRETTQYNETQLGTVSTETGTNVRFIILTMAPRTDWYAKVGAGSAYMRFPTQVRAICGRADQFANLTRTLTSAAVRTGTIWSWWNWNVLLTATLTVLVSTAIL